VSHERAAGLAQAHEDLERLAPLVLGDRDVERAKRGLKPARRAPKQLGPGPLLAPLEILGLQLVYRPPEPFVLRPQLRDLAVEIGSSALHGGILPGGPPPRVLPLLGRGAGGKHRGAPGAVAVDRHALAPQPI